MRKIRVKAIQTFVVELEIDDDCARCWFDGRFIEDDEPVTDDIAESSAMKIATMMHDPNDSYWVSGITNRIEFTQTAEIVK